DTMMTLWRRLADVPPNAQLPWAYGVARRQIANHRRAASRHLRLVRKAEAQPVHTPTTDGPLDPELHEAIAALPDHEQELLRLWAWEQLEPAEIGVALGLTANAVSIRLHRAKKRLAEKLESARKNETSSGHSHREHSKEERP
ncbi:MAG: sigma-70 family RNA polymerase sigma factor, partial [Acidimicrobiia bacterium]|nr:sigma-70 family RNA polymerase sigma factor [Acidimicrobiia bacterium]